MKKSQIFQALLKENKSKSEKTEKGTRVTRHFTEMSIYNNKGKEKINEANPIGIRFQIEKKDSKDCSALFRNLKCVEEHRGKKLIEIVNLQMLPYEIPDMYSLEFERSILHVMEKRLDVISNNMYRTDAESVSLDWKQVGGDINNAICKYRGC